MKIFHLQLHLPLQVLIPLGSAAYLKRRKEIWEALNNGTKCSTIRDRGRPPEFAAESASKTGRTKQDINRSIRRAEQLGDDIERVRGCIGASHVRVIHNRKPVKSILRVWTLVPSEYHTGMHHQGAGASASASLI